MKNAKKIILHKQSSNLHHSNKLLIVYLSITIYVGLSYHLIDFFFGDLLPKVCHSFSKFTSWDIAISVLVKHIKNLDELIFTIWLFNFPGLNHSHQGKKLWKINHTISISINFTDHILELALSGVLSNRSHDGP